MLRIHHSTSVLQAKTYFKNALSKGDYYAQGVEIIGSWGGKGARVLGLDGDVTKEAFNRLCENRHPRTGDQLTPRNRFDRRPGYDAVFSAKKSVSVAYLLTQDERILEAFHASVRETMNEMEKAMRTRVRMGGQNTDRLTGNLVSAEFTHFTTRPMDGTPDPHLHAHLYIFNATYDYVEERWKAAEVHDIKRDSPYYQAAFDARLAKRLEALGYPVERRGKNWEIAGVDQDVVRRFSRRTQEINRIAKERGIKDPERKAELGAKTRSSKDNGYSLDELRALWRDRLDIHDRRLIDSLVERAPFIELDRQKKFGSQMTAKEAIDSAIEHAFARQSVISEPRLLAHALQFGIGSVSVEAAYDELVTRDLVRRDVNGQILMTTPQMMRDEKCMVELCAEGRGTCSPMVWREPVTAFANLNAGQRAAMDHIFESQDRIIAVRGDAGVGKTTLMKQVSHALTWRGLKLGAFAPGAETVTDTLLKDGFEGAQTVRRLLLDQNLQESLRNEVIWVDEAGQLGVKQMKGLLELSHRVNARLILTGDIKQHASVEPGDALRILEESGALVPAEVVEIQRQKGEYKKAVGLIAGGKVQAGLDRFSELGWVAEIPETQDRLEQLAGDYVDALKRKQSALVVTPTHAEGEAVTEAIRQKLKSEGKIKDNDRALLSLKPTHWSAAEKAMAEQYRPGQVVQFHQNAVGGFMKGERFEVVDIRHGEVHMRNRLGFERGVPFGQAHRFGVYEKEEIELASGDRVRFTSNGNTKNRVHTLSNKQIYKLKGFTPIGDLVLSNGWVVDKNFGHIANGAYTTSYSAQGKTVDRVLISMSSESLVAAGREQFYVAVSRGRRSAMIYTDDKRDLRKAIDVSTARMSATELSTMGVDVGIGKRTKLKNRMKEFVEDVQRLRMHNEKDQPKKNLTHRLLKRFERKPLQEPKEPDHGFEPELER